MMPGVRTVIAGLVLALALPQRVSAQTSCNVSLDESIVVDAGEHRPCGIVVVGHDVAVAREGEVDGGVIIAFGHAAIDGEVNGSVNVLGGDAAVSGRVRGDVYASGIVRLGARARVDGNVTGGGIQSEVGAQVDGAATELGRGWAGMPRGQRPWLSDVALLLFKVLVTLLLGALFGALATLASPVFVGRLRSVARRGPGVVIAAMGIGLGVLVGTAGIALVLGQYGAGGAIVAVPAILALVGALGVAGRLGARLLPRRRPASQTALGLSLLAAAATVVLQFGHWALFCTGGLVLLLVGAWSIGVVVLALLGFRADRRSAVAPAERPAAAPAGVETPQPPTAPEVSWTPDEAQPPDTASEPTVAAMSAPAPALEIEHAASPDAQTGARALDGEAAEAAPLPGEAEPAPLPTDADPSPALDLRRIPGISPIYAHVLRAAGVTSLVELAERDPDDIVASLAVPGVLVVDRATAELWVSMARRRLGR